MIKTYICAECGAHADHWRQFAKDMPATLDCTCGGKASPDNSIQAPGIAFKGEGWTPPAHSDEAVLDLGGDDGDD